MGEYRGCEHPVCMVPGCMSDVPEDSQYLRKRGVCLAHLRAHSVYIDSAWYRFCQQCGRFQPLSEFKDDRRSCDASLSAHNARRRMNYKGRNTQTPSTEARVEKKSGAKKGRAALKAAAATSAQCYPWADPCWAAAAAAAGAYAASAPLVHSHSMPAGALNSSSREGWAAGHSAGMEESLAYAGMGLAGSALYCTPYAPVPGMEQYWLWQQQQQGLWYPQQLLQSCAHPQHVPHLQQQQQHQQLQPGAAMSAACMYPSDFMSGAAMVHPYLDADAALLRVNSAPPSYLRPQCRQPALMPENAPVAPPQHSTMQLQQMQPSSPEAGSNWDYNSPGTGRSEDLRAPLTPQHSSIDFDDLPNTQGGAAEPASHDDQEQQQQPVAQGHTAGAPAKTPVACAQQAHTSAGAAKLGASRRQPDSAAHVAYARIAWPAPPHAELAALLGMANGQSGPVTGQAPAQLLRALQRRQAGHQGELDNAAGLQMPGAESQCMPGTVWSGADIPAAPGRGSSAVLQSRSFSAAFGRRHKLNAESASEPAAEEVRACEGPAVCAAAMRPGPVQDAGAPLPAASCCTEAAQQSSSQDSDDRSAEALDFSYADPAALAFLESIGAIPAALQASEDSGAQLAASASALDHDLEVLLDEALDALLFDAPDSDQGGCGGCASGDWGSQAGGHACDDGLGPGEHV